MKKIIKKILKKLGLVVLKNKSYQNLLHAKNANKKLNHTIHLDFLMRLIYEIGYSPKVFFDIGAHKGGWTVSAMEYFPDANFVLFEPQADLVREINNKFVNRSNVKCFQVGVGNKNEVLHFTLVDRKDSYHFRMTKEEAQEKGFEQIEVPVIALDEFIEKQNLPKPDILKIDAEGIDLKVIKGALTTIKNHVEVVLVEVAIMNPMFENTALKVMQEMDDLGFKLFDITDLNRPFHTKVLWLSEFVYIRKNGVLDKNYAS